MMNSDPERTALLIFKFLRDELTENEENELIQWRKYSIDNEDIFLKLTDVDFLFSELRNHRETNERIWKLMIKKCPELNNELRRKKK